MGVQAMQTEYNLQPNNYEFVASNSNKYLNSCFCFSKLQFQIFKNIVSNKLVNKCTCYVIRLFVSLTFIENGLITKKIYLCIKSLHVKSPSFAIDILTETKQQNIFRVF